MCDSNHLNTLAFAMPCSLFAPRSSLVAVSLLWAIQDIKAFALSHNQHPATLTTQVCFSLQVSIQDDYNHKAIQLALLVSIMYTIIGVLRLGFLTNFLSHSVIGGFTSGAAIIIGLSQVWARSEVKCNFQDGD